MTYLSPLLWMEPIGVVARSLAISTFDYLHPFWITSYPEFHLSCTLDHKVMVALLV